MGTEGSEEVGEEGAVGWHGEQRIGEMDVKDANAEEKEVVVVANNSC